MTVTESMEKCQPLSPCQLKGNAIMCYIIGEMFKIWYHCETENMLSSPLVRIMPKLTHYKNIKFLLLSWLILQKKINARYIHLHDIKNY